MQIEILLIAIVVSVACALPGSFLVLRKMSLMSDAISHSILLGIVIVFFLSGELGSPLLLLGAVVMGIVTVTLTEVLKKTRLVYEDTAIGLVFPVLFSFGVILISKFAGNVHLDTDAVLLGELAFAPFERFKWLGIDFGPKSLVVMSGILVVNILLIIVFYKELKLATFDPGLAAAIGFSPAIIHYGLMLMVSFTAVGAFDSVGSILVVALMIAPPSTAYLITNQLSRMLIYSAIIAAISSTLGYGVAFWVDASIAGSMAAMSGVSFFLTFLFAPGRGIVPRYRMRILQKWEFSVKMLIVHVLHHQNQDNAATECHVDHLQEHINWSGSFAHQIVDKAIDKGYVTIKKGQLYLTPDGRKSAIITMEEI